MASVESGTGAGLTNMGQTCYKNAIWQALLPTSWRRLLGEATSLGRLGSVAKELFSQMEAEEEEMIPCEAEILTRHMFPQFALGVQQDAQEFLSEVLGAVRDEAGPGAVADATRGTETATYVCGECGASSSRSSAFHQL